MNSAGWSIPHPCVPVLLAHHCASVEPPLPARAASALPGASLSCGTTRNSRLPGFFFHPFFSGFHCHEQQVKNKQRVGVQRQPQCLRCSSPPHCHKALGTQRFPVTQNQDNKILARNLNVGSPSQAVCSIKICLGKELDGILSLRV